MIRQLLLISLLSLSALAGWSQASVEGKVSDVTTGEAVMFANVVLFRNGIMVNVTQTDLDGNYVFSSVDPGTYDIEASFTGYPPQRQTGVTVFAGRALTLDFKLNPGQELDAVVVIEYNVPLIEKDNTTQGGIKTAEQIRNLPVKNINAIAATTAGLSTIDGSGINIRGSRSNATNYYLDGIRVYSANVLPQTEIEQLQVITGGIEAKYGDVTGGLISLTSKGPSSTFSAYVEGETSELTDPYGYNLLNASISGPILKSKNTGNTLIGFRLNGQFRDRKEPNPRAFGGFFVKESTIDRIAEDPLTFVNGAPIALIERLEAGDVDTLKARRNVRDTRYDLVGKLDFRLSDAIDFTVGGTYFSADGHFSPSRAYSMLNWQYHPYNTSNGYILNARFRHRIGGNPSLTMGVGEASSSLIRNISYTLQYGMERRFNEEGDDRHRDNLFNYGYVGSFDVSWVPVTGTSTNVDTNDPFITEIIPGVIWGKHFGYGEMFAEGGYNPSSSINRLLTNYNKEVPQPQNFRNYYAYNGVWSSLVNNGYDNMFTGTGAIYNTYSKDQSDIHTGSLSASFDLFPGGSDRGRHNIQFGLLVEQRVNRFWGINPRALWNTMRLAANSNIIGLDSSKIVGVDSIDVIVGGQQIRAGVNIYETLVNEKPELLFYQRVRQLTGQGLHEYVNVDGLNPEDLSLSMFAAEELVDAEFGFNYYGYDHTGKKLPYNVSFNDFFTAVDEAGRRTLPVAPNKPIYTAAYIQDKFTFRDIIFRLGVRVDRYDANTKVLRDPYSLYGIMTAGDFFKQSQVDFEKPPAVQDHWKVYVVSDGSTSVRAYRDGDQWYTAQGTPVNDGSEILGSEVPIPFYIDQDPTKRDIRVPSRYDENTQQILGFNPDNSFEDYKPQLNIMPRLAFSFPISDEANFFVHYDVLVQRPPSNTIATPLDYFKWHTVNSTANNPKNNPNLKPEKTIDFEVGFKQKVSNSSAITLSAYYKEMRDMIQSRNFLHVPGVPGNSYASYGNIDFGTVKGFSFSYDLRRTRNLELTASYTVQFADGTGSDANSQSGLNARGNIRYLSPLSFDERHRIGANIDFRYASGPQYNGPRWFGKDVFANAGVNLQVNAASGKPYTRRQRPERFGSSGVGGDINGARLPWNFTVDMRVDKDFRISTANAARPISTNVYLRVENLFDARNILGVYAASGSAYDDGFLVTPLGQSSIQVLNDSGRADDIDNYLLAYQWGMVNPGFFTLPRRVYLGAIVQF